MTRAAKRELRECVRYFGLQVKYVRGLPDKVSGFLQPGSDPQYIFLNEGKSRSDHAFTIAHELGHYVMHLDRPLKNRTPEFLDYHGESEFFLETTQMTKEWVQRFFEPEGEADAWAFALLLRLGATDDLLTILELYPKKFWMFLAICASSTFNAWKSRITNFFQVLFDAFKGRSGHSLSPKLHCF
jgi:hypothetical protein